MKSTPNLVQALLGTLFYFIIPGLVLAEPGPIAKQIAENMDQRQIPGIAVGIQSPIQGRTIHTFGYADLEHRVRVTEQTLFRFASVSKPITAVATLRLAEAERLQLESTLDSLEWEIPQAFRLITVRQLLAHQSGVRHYQHTALDAPLKHFNRLQDAMTAQMNDPLLFVPGRRYTYSTQGYLILGCALEQWGEASFPKLIQKWVFQPAQMTTARVDHLYAIIPNRARGYFRSLNGQIRNSIPMDTSDKIPGGGLLGSIEDLMAFAEAILSDRLLTPETKKSMWREQLTLDGAVTGYGLGWNVPRTANRFEVYHCGSQSGASSILYLRPDDRIAIAMLANLEQINFLQLARSLADLSAP